MKTKCESVIHGMKAHNYLQALLNKFGTLPSNFYGHDNHFNNLLMSSIAKNGFT